MSAGWVTVPVSDLEQKYDNLLFKVPNYLLILIEILEYGVGTLNNYG